MDRTLQAGLEPGSVPTAGSNAGRSPALLPGTRWLSWALVGASGLVGLAWVYLAVAHADDRYRLDHVSGVRIALARAFEGGTLYPPLYDGMHVGGTRFMPLPIVLHGALARLTGEYVTSGKLLAYAAAVALVAAVVVLLRRRRCPLPFALALAVVVVTTNSGLSGSLNLRADILPLLLQVLAIGVVAETRSSRATVGAAALAALAFVTKLSAVWAPVAIVLWLLVRDRRRAAWFVGAYVALAGALLGMFAIWSDGRIVENVFGLATSGVTSVRDVVGAPYRLVHLLVSDATTAWGLLPLAGLALWVGLASRRVSLYVVSLVVALAVLLVVLLDVGTGWNQLVDLVVLASLVTGELVGESAGAPDDALVPPAALLPVVGLVLVSALLGGFVVMLAPEVGSTLRGTASYRVDPLAGVATRTTTLLSEDPYVPVSLGQTPIVFDPFMLPRLAERAPSAVADVARRIEAQDFDLVVLVEPLQPIDRQWWNDEDLGPEVVRAIAEAYRYAGRAQGYYIYVPSDLYVPSDAGSPA
jgi:hypothetical protein